MKVTILIICFFLLVACTSIDKNNMKLSKGMSKAEVLRIMGEPDQRSFNGDKEALQFQGIIGYGQCIYVTAWFYKDVIVGTTDRRVASIAGCGIGSKEVDWLNMPDY